MHASVLEDRRMREGDAYRPFPDIGWRNFLQRTLEVPLLVGLLRLPRGRRMLEVGCGRGIGVQALARLCAPDALTGIDIDDGDLLQEAARALRERRVRADLFRADVRDMRLAHPTRASGRPMPWLAVPELVPYRTALLWSARKKTGVR